MGGKRLHPAGSPTTICKTVPKAAGIVLASATGNVAANGAVDGLIGCGQ
jgi:hypothetical protein